MKINRLGSTMQFISLFALIFPFLLTVSCKKQQPLPFFTTTTEVRDAPLVLDTNEVKLPYSNNLPMDPTLFRNGRNATIVVLGSSTAAGSGASSPSLAWVQLLKAKLEDDNKGINVVNLAVGGFTTFKIMPATSLVPINRPDPDLNQNITAALKLHPFLILINMPTNDIAANYTDDEILGNFKVLRSIMDSAHVDYIFTGTQPRNFATVEQRRRLEILDTKILKAYPNHVVDILRKLSKESYYINDYYSAGDGVHLNDHGHKVIYSYFLRLPLFQHLLGYHF
jgi:acyl-CoA thioesterase-1